MIIFDLDGTLADCEHRRHFVDHGNKFEPDWKSFYEHCDKDKPIEPVIDIFNSLCETHLMSNISIWSGRCESVRDKTLNWLSNHIDVDNIQEVKLRPIGDSTPDDMLKERWLDEALKAGNKVHFVFDDGPKVVRMWRRRGIFVFDCNQSGKEF